MGMLQRGMCRSRQVAVARLLEDKDKSSDKKSRGQGN